jgi:hypothetical protein
MKGKLEYLAMDRPPAAQLKTVRGLCRSGQESPIAITRAKILMTIDTEAIANENDITELLKSLGFKSIPTKPMKYITFGNNVIHRTIDATENGLDDSAIVSLEKNADDLFYFRVRYMNHNWAMYELWDDTTPGRTTRTELREMILVATSTVEVRKRNLEHAKSNTVNITLLKSLGDFVERGNLGWLWQEMSFLSDPVSGKWARIDSFFISKDRLREEPTSTLQIAPDLVIRTKHPGEGWEFQHLPHTLLELGVGTVWQINPFRRFAVVYEEHKKALKLQGDQHLGGTGALKGFSICVDDFINSEWDGTSTSIPRIKIRPKLRFADYVRSIWK